MSEKNSGYLDMELLRFTTAGSVDDGKSTLIGRLLYDSKAIFEDQMEAIEKASERIGNEEVNLALLTDGLRAEREQGITIDVAYRYFATPKRKFIIADTPGHIQYTRNMVTGASTANVAIILVDARHGVLEQTMRHSYIASLLQIPHVIFCINKMDLMDYAEETFEKIKGDIDGFSSKLSVKDIRFVPISALNGDNVVDRSTKMDWYQGPTLLHLLENIHIGSDINHSDFRFPVQYVIRPQSAEFPDYRGYGGRIASGAVKVGDPITVLPSGFTSKVKTIDFFEDSLKEAFAPQSVTITLEDEIDISRGDMLVKSDNLPNTTQDLELMICWFNERNLVPRGKYVIKHTSADARCMVTGVQYKMDINSLEKNTDDLTVGMNDIAKVNLRVTKPLHVDSYQVNRFTGSIILVDEGTNETVAAGMIL
ncbi:sulfate adenylyltransferase subunit CysN [Saccharicrinis fermentans]|uniref:sulfate adenylyltransferase n=1 Tax=Saccharicrinis fermentans DSM 9555 = JCM 21142 TaxID=869213 RepID=W7YCP3_9BACT|nr:sulfate adenylyltransferase subunit CysN [Saccharicrinis fermentans]GAF02231.1 bifunctional enzyme CysN/CysC [Saccharicrinis fermentans DSM 9555 = JCM 21142]